MCIIIHPKPPVGIETLKFLERIHPERRYMELSRLSPAQRDFAEYYLTAHKERRFAILRELAE
jgi:hypothetical protein